MKFTKTSGLVNVWLQLILSGARSLEEVPKLGNLYEAVKSEVSKTNHTD